MTKRPPQTLLLITRDRLVRADFAHGKLLNLWQQSNLLDTDDPSLQVESAIALGPAVGRKVWVLSTDLWTQIVTLSSTATVSLSDADLSQALSFEVEPLSGIGVIEAAVGKRLIKRSGREQQYWITQGRTGDLERIEESIRGAGGSLAGICHPGGLPEPLSSAGKETWQRIELWPNAIFCLQGGGSLPIRMLIINADPQEGRWRVEKEQWEKAAGDPGRHEIMLTTGDLLGYRHGEEPAPLLDRDATLTAWLTGWSKHLSGKFEMPVVRAPRAPLSSSQRNLIMAALLLLAVGLCAGHHYAIAHVLMPPRQAELSKLEGLAAEVKGIETQKKSIDKKREELTKASAELQAKIDTCQTALHSHRWRLAKLLASLGDDQPKDVLVEKIAAEPSGPHVFGIAVHSQLANQYAASLNEKLHPFGWQAHLESQSFAAEKGMYQFSIALEEVLAPTGDSIAPVKSGRTKFQEAFDDDFVPKQAVRPTPAPIVSSPKKLPPKILREEQ